MLQAHEEGRVVFFCGAGVSYPAGLPGFADLVAGMYTAIGEPRSAVQQAAFDARQYDTAVGLLEDAVGSREIVRRELSGLLKPDLTRPHALDTHEALLTLAKTRGGATRLITTNFDRLFHHAADSRKFDITAFCAPFLPVPKNRWDGVVFLHGLLTETPSREDLDRLVISSGDFGLAYLTERWAARFVGELFRNYVVCFVGYSLNDPVVRYMTDALAADRLRGEAQREMFAFASYKKKEETRVRGEWRAKNVTPILYKETKTHSLLHETIRTWADTYGAGTRGKERIVTECLLTGPVASTKQDDHIGRMLWAMSDPEGLPAKAFADYAPTPPLTWLEHFFDERFNHNDLPRFGVTPNAKCDSTLKFSLASRPTPYSLSPNMSLVSDGAAGGGMDAVMSHLTEWLLRHLDDPDLVVWLAARGGKLNDEFVRRLKSRLAETAKLEESESVEDISQYTNRSPKGIPRAEMRTLWSIVLSGRVKSAREGLRMFDWVQQFRRDGMTMMLRHQLTSLLSARVLLRKPFRALGSEQTQYDGPQSIKYLVNPEVVLSSDDVRSHFDDIRNFPEWKIALPQLFDAVRTALVDVLDLMREMGQADGRQDLGVWHMPSISDHWQNRNFNEWTILIELVRDSWAALYETEPERARWTLYSLLAERYPTFKRLALHAAVSASQAAPDDWVAWLCDDEGWWLWSRETQREVSRLLMLRSSALSERASNVLQTAILAGPPRRMYKDDIDVDRWTRNVDSSQWLRLAKLHAGGANLINEAAARLEALQAQYPKWRFGRDEREEFFHWMSGSGDPDYEAERQIELAPRERKLLTNWLQKRPQDPFLKVDDWKEVCASDFTVAIVALLDLARRGIWPVERWGEALQVWSNGELVQRSWKRLAPCVAEMPREKLLELANSVTWWQQEVGKDLRVRTELFFQICERCIVLASDDELVNDDDPVFRAINHPVGHVALGLFNWWYSTKPEDKQGLPPAFAKLLKMLCDTTSSAYRHGRLILASNVVALLRVDEMWTAKNLLPQFDWAASELDARRAWVGFLWTPRLYAPLLSALKKSFLDSASRFTDLGESGSNYTSLLTLSALEPSTVFTRQELRAATRALPGEGLEQCARALLRAIANPGEQRSEYWSSRAKPYLEGVWPKSPAQGTAKLADLLARVSIAAGPDFPEAFELVKRWLTPIRTAHQLTMEFEKAGIGVSFPRQGLALLHAVIDRQYYPPPPLGMLLETIGTSEPALLNTRELQALKDYVRQFQ
nr:anti-phage defense-associated sirtuin Dsr1 [Caballeronia sp. dw_276]